MHRAVYHRAGEPLTLGQRLTALWGIRPLPAWSRVEAVVRFKEGVAREVSRWTHRALG